MSEIPGIRKRSEIGLEDSWKDEVGEEFEKEYFRRIKRSLLQDKSEGIDVYPPSPLIFNAFNSTPFKKVKVVILGQDPYHGVGQAHGLCFSVPEGIEYPPSLKNIFSELENDLRITRSSGDLSDWAAQGVFLLNAMLTVKAKEAGSHSRIGWQNFTDAAIRALSEGRSGLVFLLWGGFAGRKKDLIDGSKHLILRAPHPSPLSAHRGFFGCSHFSKTNAYLKRQGKEPINW